MSYRVGTTLAEEIAACMLGGYGIKAEIGLAAFYMLRDYGLLSCPPPSDELIERALAEPLFVNRRRVRYRFAGQRSRYLGSVLRQITAAEPPEEDLEFREWLLGFSGIGPKTASWITRNWKSSDAVAVIDVHIQRACHLMGLFGPEKLPRDYFLLEQLFLRFARAIDARPSVLDMLMWNQMRSWGKLADLDILH